MEQGPPALASVGAEIKSEGEGSEQISVCQHTSSLPPTTLLQPAVPLHEIKRGK